MQITRLRKSGGSLMMTVPKTILESLDLHADQELSISIENNSMVVKPKSRPRYSLKELLAQCDFSLPMAKEEREWLDAPTVGREEN